MLPSLGPKEIRAYIEKRFQGGVVPSSAVDGHKWDPQRGGWVETVLTYMADLDPRYLQGLSLDDRHLLDESLAELRLARERFVGPVNRHDPWTLKTTHVSRIYEILGKCPPELEPVADDRLKWIQDSALRKNLARDVDSLTNLLAHREAKAATVLAGSVVEALLLHQVERHAGLAALLESKREGAPPNSRWRKEPADWGLELLLQACSALDVLSDAEHKACASLQQYRNLIHPGKERAQQVVNEGTATLGLGTVQLLLAKWGT